MPKLQLRFQKYDQFNNPVFIASKGQEDEKESYDRLKSYHKQLSEPNYGTFLPIFHSSVHGYSTIRFKSFQTKKLMKNDVYEINFKIKKIFKDNRVFINCYVDSAKLLRVSSVDTGEDVELED